MVDLQINQELPSSDYFDENGFELTPEDPRFKKIISEIGKVYLAQSINDQLYEASKITSIAEGFSTSDTKINNKT